MDILPKSLLPLLLSQCAIPGVSDKNTHFSPPKPSEVFRIIIRAEDTNITNSVWDDGLATHPAPTAVTARWAKGVRESLLPRLLNPIPDARTAGYAGWTCAWSPHF